MITIQSKITDVRAREIIDGRGTPTVEVDIWLDNFPWGWADVPSGCSTGSREACEICDGDSCYGGLGVCTAVDNVNRVIALAVIGYDVT